MAEASRTESYAQEAAKQNMILDGWTQEWGLRVYPWYSNDKLKFSFVEKGAAGKGKSFDVYVNCQKPDIMGRCMDTWAYDILDGSFTAILKAEKAAGERYPKYYQIATGNKGQKTVGIMASDTPGSYVINAKSGDGKYCNIRITHAALKLFARRYLESYEARRKQLENMRSEAEAHQHFHDSDGDYVPKEQTPVQEQAQQPAQPTQQQMQKGEETEVKCILKGDIETKKGMRIVAMYDPYTDVMFGKLYIKSGSPAMNTIIQIPVEKKGSNYLLINN